MENNFNDQPPSINLSFDGITSVFLEEIRRWAYFLSILGFVGVGFLLLFGVFFGSVLSNFVPTTSSFPMQFLSMIYVVIAVFYFFPVLYLYRFAVNMKTALYDTNQEKLHLAFNNMRSLFRFLGISTIIVVSLYLVVIVSAIIYSVVSRF